MKTTVGMILLLGIVGSGTAVYLSGSKSQTTSSLRMPVDGNETQTVIGIGYVEPASEVRRLGFKVDGTVRKCCCEIGASISAGQLLMCLDDNVQRAALAVAEADLRSARADLGIILAGTHPKAIEAAEHRHHRAVLAEKTAHREFMRLRGLMNTKSVSEREADRAESLWQESDAEVRVRKAEVEQLRSQPRSEEKSAAEARVALAESRVASAKSLLGEMSILAPSDGTVLEILKREGDVARASEQEPAIIFADTRQLRVRAEVDERFAHSLREGLTAEVYGRALGQGIYPGRVSVVKQLMGPKTIFSRAAAERNDLDVIQLFVDLPSDFRAPVGLRVDVKIVVE